MLFLWAVLSFMRYVGLSVGHFCNGGRGGLGLAANLSVSSEVKNLFYRTEIDRTNPWAGRTIGAFCCDKPQVIDGQVFFAFQKTPDGNGESYGSEVFFMRSKDLVRLEQEGKMADATWETLPKGERGLQTRQGLLLGEEPHVIQVRNHTPYNVDCSMFKDKWAEADGILEE